MVNSSGSVFSETLQTITSTKLEELAKQRIAFEGAYAKLLAAAKAESDALKRVYILVDGTKSCLGVKVDSNTAVDGRPGRVISGATNNPRLEVDLINLDRFLEQARFDPSVSVKVLGAWEKTLLQYLSVQSTRFQYADLYGKLIHEWLSSDKTSSTGDDVEMAESYEEIPGAKRLAARTEWEKNVFAPADVNNDNLRAYLEELFITGKKDAATAIREMRKNVQAFETRLSNSSQFTVHTLRSTINSLQNSDLLSNEKREALKDFLSNDVILAEIADILNVRMAALDRWTWGESVSLEQRRKLNGDFSIHFDPDLLQAIFLHYIGNKWSVFFKQSFLTVYDHAAWETAHVEVSKTDRMRRRYFLGDKGLSTQSNLQDKRIRTHRNRYFAHQLLDHENQEFQMQDGEEEAEYGEYVEMSRKRDRAQDNDYSGSLKMSVQRPRGPRAKQTARKGRMPMQSMALSASMAPRRSAEFCDVEAEVDDEEGSAEEDTEEEDDEGYQAVKRPMEAKHGLLHLVSTEIIINKRLHEELTCFRTVFESWNPLLPHETILSILEFFGVGETWRRFFLKFLQAPLKFTDDQSEPRLRRRGTPGSHSLSDVLGEAVLFCLDYKVNQVTEGALLHRLYDDVWFWNKDYSKCTRAWASIVEFADITGVEVSLIRSLCVWSRH